jgi:hypothetical protein
LAAAIESGVFGYRNAVVVVPSDTTDLVKQARALWVGTTGDLAVSIGGGPSIVLSNVQPGTLLPILVNRVFATGTTAAFIVALS